MSWPGGFDAPSGDSPQDNSSGDPFDSSSSNLDRPTSLSQLGIFQNGRLVGMTPAQVKANLRLTGSPFDTFPQLPAFAPLFRRTTDWHKKQVAAAIAQLAGEAGRVVTPDEADAIAYHTSQCFARTTWGPPITTFGSAYMVYRNRTTFRFPFYTPTSASFNPLCFPSTSKPIIKGSASVILWHSLRFSAYWLAFQVFVQPFVTSFATTTCMANMLLDKRLKSLYESIKRHKGHLAGPLPRQGGPPQQPAQQQPPLEQAPPQKSPWARPASEQQDVPQQDTQFDDGHIFDDASPVSPAQQGQRPAVGTPPSTGGTSAWERIRQRAKAEEGAPWTPPQRHAGTPGRQPQRTESYMMDPSEQEKAYAKDQAQKEFDEMLERERRSAGDSGWRG
ncbi:hypothetical protein VTJ49DRAFT_5607 [Mycothermus thermophilus]|uniref:Uncharacterized protein n=1 Tax=Humicola insolens TaxID=85995 RepID=A0ABR3V2S2_HUMIN